MAFGRPLSRATGIRTQQQRRLQQSQATDRVRRWLHAAFFADGRLPELDGARGLAVLSVVVFHFWLMSGSPELALSALPGLNLTFLLAGGMAGVQLFFVLSGFMLFLPWARAEAEGKPPPSIRRYLERRLLRVAPAYYLNLLAIAFLVGPAAVYSSSVPLGWDLLAHLLFLQNLSPATHQGINGVTWTLAIEAQFYLALPFIAPLALRLGPIWTVVAAVAVAATWRVLALLLVGPQDAQHLWMLAEQLPGEFDQFGFGMATGMLWLRLRQRQRQDGPTIALLGSLLLVLGSLLVLAALYRYHTCECLFGQGAYDLPWWNSTVGLGFAAFVLGSLTAWRWLRVVLASRPLRLLGVASYGIFLWHYQLGDLLERAGLRDLVPSGGGQLAWLGLVAGPLAIIVGGLSWILVERPFLEQRPARQTPSAKRTLWPSPLGG